MMECMNMMDGMMGGMMPGSMMPGGGQAGIMSFWNLLGFVWSGALWAGLVAVIGVATVWLVRRSGELSSKTGVDQGEVAEPWLETLKRRLAQGEITPEQFDAIKHQLQEN